MPTVQIGRAAISYDLRRSATASERRIIVTPGHVEVIALTSDDDIDIGGFLNRKRQWLFNTVREMEARTANRHSVPRFVTGSRIPFRGRKMRLTVRRSDAERMQITYRNGFIVDLPAWAGADTDPLVARELKLWLKQQARREVMEAAKVLGDRFYLRPRSIRVADFRGGWGSCGQDGNVLINWHLIFAPRKVLEYVVAHELAHLVHRSHGEQFWRFLETILPGHATAKDWLDQHQTMLDSTFLNVATKS